MIMSSRLGITQRARAGLIAVIAASAVALAACTGGGTITTSGSPSASSPARSGSGNASTLLASSNTGTYDPNTDPVVQAVKEVAPAVVNITTRTQAVSSIFGGGSSGRDVGTGFIVRSDGVVVTNYHVVEGGVSIKVTLPQPDGRSFDARVIGSDSDHDLAVLKVDATGLPVAPLGSSAQLQLGERVVALGYALALPGGPTVTSGIVSSLDRTIQVQDPSAGITRTYNDALQTDAAINPGNSGGPLIDLNGNVVGIDSAGSQQAQNIGFAIGIDTAKQVIQQAILNPKAAVAYLGVTTETVTSGVAAQFGLSVDTGALVVGLSPNGPSEKAGIKVGDVIVRFDGTTVSTSDGLGSLIQKRKPGDRVTVVVAGSGGSQRTISVTLGTRPGP
jgi:S1-C subfamily serine protease